MRDAAGDRFDALTLNIYPSVWAPTITDDEKFLRMRAELGISSILLGDLDELTPVLERLAGQ